MKSKFMQVTAATFIALLIYFGATQIFVSGQEDAEKPPRLSQSIEGVWKTTVTQRNCQTGAAIGTFPGLSTFHEGGTISEMAAQSNPSLRSPGHGVWEKQRPGTFRGSFVFLRFNPDGTFAGIQKITVTNVLTGNGDSFDSTASVQIFDANDVLVGTGCATATATRFE